MYYLERLHELQESADKGQKGIAEYLGITQQQYSLYEAGTRHIKVEHLVASAKYYKVTADYILGLTDKEKA